MPGFILASEDPILLLILYWHLLAFVIEKCITEPWIQPVIYLRVYSLQAVTRHFSGRLCQREVCPSDSNVMTSSTQKVKAVALVCTCLLLLLLVIIWPVSFSDVEYYEVSEEIATEFAKGSQWGGNFNGGKQSNICSCNSYNSITVDIRDLKTRRRWRQRQRQRERQKKQWV